MFRDDSTHFINFLTTIHAPNHTCRLSGYTDIVYTVITLKVIVMPQISCLSFPTPLYHLEALQLSVVCDYGLHSHVIPQLAAFLSAIFSFSDDMSLVPQFGTSFATFRPALSHSGSTRPLSVILPVPASPPYTRLPGSSSSSPTSKVPMWKVCFPFASISSVAPFLLFSLRTENT